MAAMTMRANMPPPPDFALAGPGFLAGPTGLTGGVGGISGGGTGGFTGGEMVTFGGVGGADSRDRVPPFVVERMSCPHRPQNLAPIRRRSPQREQGVPQMMGMTGAPGCANATPHTEHSPVMGLILAPHR